jgi:UDP-glucose 4-epimerase
MPESPSAEPTLPGVADGDEADHSATEPTDDAAVPGAATQGDVEADVEAHQGGVLVIGGAGFVGSHLVDRLIAEGRHVDVVDDLSTGSLANLAAARTEATRLDVGELHFHTLDACSDDLATLISLRRPREIYHLALVTRRELSATSLGRSFTSMLGVLEAARKAGAAKVIVSLPATALYGQPSGRDLPVKEGALNPRGVRGVVAKAIVDLLSAYREDWGIEFTALALASVYGPRQRPDAGVVAALVEAARTGRAPTLTGDGRQSRDFVYVDDVVDALVRAGQRGSGLVINIGTGVQTSLRDLWKLIAPDGPEPVYAPARPDEVLRFAVSPVRARIHLAWSPWTSLAEGLDALRSL